MNDSYRKYRKMLAKHQNMKMLSPAQVNNICRTMADLENELMRIDDAAKKPHCDRCAGKHEVECNVLCDNCLLELRGI